MSDLADLLEQRRAIDRALQEKHAADMAVLFTDIVGSTAYFEQRGDVEGLALVHRHNDLLFPLVEQHRGRIVKTIGDAIMAVYSTATDAAVSASLMMQALEDDAKRTGKEPIRIRIGAHFGSVLKDTALIKEGDVFGDTVNVAARVNSACAPDEILVSQAFIDTVTKESGSNRFVVEERAAVAAKGKNAPVPVQAILWRKQEIADTTSKQAATRLFVLSIEQGPQGLRVSALDGEAGKGTVKRHVDHETTPAMLSALAEECAVLAHDGGQASYRAPLIEKGVALTAAAFPKAVLERLQKSENRALRLHVDDSVARVPFELCRVDVDGESQWLGCAFAVGRVVSAPDLYGIPKTGAGLGKNVVVIADPAGDLEHARKEGELIAGLYRSVLKDPRKGDDAVVDNLVVLSGAVTKAQLLDAVKDCRVLHIAGHVDRTSNGIVCADGVVDGRELATAFAFKVPALVFANACHASTAAPWSTTTLTKALLDCGVRHVLAPLWAVPDRDALSFSLRFTEAALAGAPLGEATRRARLALLTGVGSDQRAPLSFAGYVLFGDPRTTLPFEGARLQGAGRTRSADAVPGLPVLSAKAPAKTSTETSSSEPKSKSPVVPIAAALSLVAVAAIGFAITRPAAPTTNPTNPTTNAVTAAHSTATPTVATPKQKREGPVRLSVLPFQGPPVEGMSSLGEGLTEALVTGLAGAPGIKLVERGQIDVDIKEIDFQNSQYVDPTTRAQLGKINGAEVVVLGAHAVSGDSVRITARYVDVESGEVLFAVKVDGEKSKLFDLQDQLVETVTKSLPQLTKRVRP